MINICLQFLVWQESNVLRQICMLFMVIYISVLSWDAKMLCFKCCGHNCVFKTLFVPKTLNFVILQLSHTNREHFFVVYKLPIYWAILHPRPITCVVFLDHFL